MTCPSCHSPLESTARFCGVCGYRLAPGRSPASAADGAAQAAERVPRAPLPGVLNPSGTSGASARGAAPAGSSGKAAQAAPLAQAQAPQGQAQKQSKASKPREPVGDEIYINQVLNNRFKVESKIGEGGFGAVYRGLQLATGRKVALKLLHPEMTKDENLVARFRREGMVLCNLRDAHTITTYDFDQTPDGTLYIAMELLEGKSLHQLFHEQAPLAWKRVFKILTEMCSSLAEAHARGIVHRDLKPENIYLESRSGNPEFVKILDFGIAKVMRGDTIDPQSPQLTATGQTLGTLEYMSPEQLMGKQLDGRSDVYALGVLAYEMITGRLPFPDAKGPAGLITAQLKQTPAPPSQANPKAGLPKAADRAILKCLEKDKNNRFPDVTALATALQDAISGQSAELEALKQLPIPGGANRPAHEAVDMVETRRGDLPNMPPPPLPITTIPGAAAMPGMTSLPAMTPMGPQHPPQLMTPPAGSPFAPQPRPMTPPPLAYPPGPGGPGHNGPGGSLQHPHGRPPTPMPMPQGTYPQPAPHHVGARPSSNRFVWWVLALLVVGAGVGTVLALVFNK